MKKYEPRQMVASSRYRNYFPTLSAEIWQDVYSRMNELLMDEKEYCDNACCGPAAKHEPVCPRKAGGSPCAASNPRNSPDTRIEYWYGQEEKKARKLDISWMKKHIPGVRFRKLPGMDHGQYALMQPKQFAEDLRRILVGSKA